MTFMTIALLTLAVLAIVATLHNITIDGYRRTPTLRHEDPQRWR